MKYNARHLSESEFTTERIRARQRGEYGDEHRDRDLDKKRIAREIANQRDQKREVRGIPFLSNR